MVAAGAAAVRAASKAAESMLPSTSYAAPKPERKPDVSRTPSSEHRRDTGEVCIVLSIFYSDVYRGPLHSL